MIPLPTRPPLNSLAAVVLLLTLLTVSHAQDAPLTEMTPAEIEEMRIPDLQAKLKGADLRELSEDQLTAIRTVMRAHVPQQSDSSRNTARLIKFGTVVGIGIAAFLVRRWLRSRTE